MDLNNEEKVKLEKELQACNTLEESFEDKEEFHDIDDENDINYLNSISYFRVMQKSKKMM